MTIQIRSGGSASIQVRYRLSIYAVLRDVRRTQTGRIVLNLLDQAGYDVIIEPNLDPAGSNNASEIGASGVHEGNARLGVSARGTRSFVAYSPNRLTGRGVGMGRDEVLLHELCHSLRTVNGRMRKRSNGQLLAMAGGFHNVEEFFAAMVTNVHSSELGRPARGDHGTGRLRSIDQLRKPPFDRRLRQFSISMPVLCRQLAALPPTVAPFNPFRDIATVRA